ncbi:MAG: SMI1/KNR4 family protein [Planctomycetaceae bacterium]
MGIDKLAALMPPPEDPLFNGTQEQWDRFKREVGLELPEDYFLVVTTYGSGRFLAGEFKVANPFDPDDQDFASFELTRLREMRERSPEDVPFALYPEEGGLYPFGIDGNGNTFLWKTNSNPGKWEIVCFNSEDYSESVNHSLIEFLVLLATNKLDINRRKFWGSDVAADSLEYVPRRVSRKRRKTS